ncbi:MAG: hypothetical protein ACI9VR_000815 [Cognaticolwellia sp.]|jgi:hypothetical protein
MSEINRKRVRTLRLLCTTWFRDQSGVARSEAVQGKGIVVKGFARDLNSLRFLDRGLMAGDLSFTEAEVYGDAERRSMVGTLWKQGQALSSPEAVAKASHAILVIQANQSFFEYLTLSKPMIKLLRGDHQPWESLGFILEKNGLAMDSISRELGCLVAMGMVRLRAPGRNAPPPKSKAAKRLRQGDPADRALRAQMQRVMLQRRLEREWTQLQGQDDFTLLGVPSDGDPEQMQVAAKRMTKRYQQLSQKRGLTLSGRELATKIRERVDAAAERLAKGKAHTAAHKLLESPEQAFEEGKRLAKAKDWANAVTCLATAKRTLEDPDVVAWLGFAHFHDLRHSRKEREAKGREMLMLAESFGAPSASRLRVQLRPEGARSK